MNTERYQKQILLKEFGISAQQKLHEASVLVVGAGGLGCPALLYLAAAGVGRIGIVDFDIVEVSNLHRQILYTAEDAGKSKAVTAGERLGKVNPEIVIDVFNLKLDTTNCLDIIRNFDLIIDGSDNFPTRYLINDASVLLNKPYIYGSVFRFEGQVGVFNSGTKETSANYRDVFPVPPGIGEVADCNEAGVLGVLTGIIGSMQASEAIKIITGVGNVLANKLITYNSLYNSFYEINIERHQESQINIPENAGDFMKMNYEFHNSCEHNIQEISAEEFAILSEKEEWQVIDVRKIGELPEMSELTSKRIPLHEISSRLPEIDFNKSVLFFCQSGIRSMEALNIVIENNNNHKVYSLKGGIVEWIKYQKRKPVNL